MAVKHDWLVEQKEAYELYADKIFGILKIRLRQIIWLH